MNFNELVKATLKSRLGSKVEQKGKFDYLSWAHAIHILGNAYPDFTFEVRHFPQLFTRKVAIGANISRDRLDSETIRESPAYDTEYYTLPDVVVPYNRTSTGYYVEVSVTADKLTRTQVHPVLDGRNQPIAQPNSFQINTSIQRALAKAIALHGVGLSLYAGEDLEDIE